MAGLLSELTALLSEQAENVDNLLALSIEKKEVIVNNDVPSLQKITALENTIVGSSQRLEKKCLILMQDIANVLNQDAATFTLSTLLGLVEGQPEHTPLLELKGRMTQAAEALAQSNDQNRLLINHALDYIDFTMNMIRSTTAPDVPHYGGNHDNTPTGTSLFDAKQ